MWLNDFSSDIDWQSEAWFSMWNVSEQVSEAYKEQVKKSGKQVKKTKKDEKKSKRHDMLLAKFLVKILLEKKYDKLLPLLFKAFDAGVPSNLILGIMSLVYIEISHSIHENIWKPHIDFNFSIEDTLKFSGENLPSDVKNRINSWVEDIQSVILFNPSELDVKKVWDSLRNSEDLYTFSVEVFIYFLSEINIYITQDTAKEYIIFIFKKIILQKMKES